MAAEVLIREDDLLLVSRPRRCFIEMLCGRVGCLRNLHAGARIAGLLIAAAAKSGSGGEVDVWSIAPLKMGQTSGGSAPSSVVGGVRETIVFG